MPTDFDGEPQVDFTSYLTKTVADVRYLNQSGDTMEGDLNMNSHRVTNLPIPTADTEAATKSYVDSRSSNHFTYGDKAIQMKKGKGIDMNKNKLFDLLDPTGDQQASTKKYVDTAASRHSSHLTYASVSLKSQ